MNTSLQLSIGQHLTLTPQLQQAIRLLQLSTIELRQEIEQALVSNPMLIQEEQNESSDEPDTEETRELTDVQWLEPYRNTAKNNTLEEYNDDNRFTTTTNLREHLHWQLGLTPMSDIDRMIAMLIIDAVNDDGFLTQSIEELHANFLNEPYDIDIQEIQAVRHRIQHFDPLGCASLNLKEALLVQIRQFQETEDTRLCQQVVEQHIDLLGQHNYRQLMKFYHINEATLNRILTIIHKLNPKPGAIIAAQPTEYLIPDLTTKKRNGAWVVRLNDETLPRININQQYAALIQRADSSTDNQFLKEHLQEARWFLKSIQSRQETLLKVASCIMAHQTDFLEKGDEAMKPLILHDVAQTLDLHESTVSRVTTQKYIHTPRGIFELKYFFSSHVTTNNGGECSSTAIRALIKKLIAAENPKKPLSDNKIADLISKEGIQIARRTVAKYRELMGIYPSNERKICF